MFQEWPNVRSVPESIHPFWNYRDELAVEDGLIFKAHKLVIPSSQKHEFLKDLHVDHLGEEETPLRARECIYWPSITSDIKEYIKECSICQSMKPSQQKESLIPHDVPSGQWEKVWIDIFQYESCKYLLVADYSCNLLLIRILNTPIAAHCKTSWRQCSQKMGYQHIYSQTKRDNSHLLNS